MAKFYSANPPVKKDVEVPLRRHFSRLPDDYHVCLEFDVNRTNYDVVIIHSTGIHVIEVKNHSRIVYGGPEDPLWHVKDDDGNIITQSKNFYNQTTRQVNALKDYLRSHSTAILDSKCQPQRCSGNRLCNYHADFWTKLSIFPHLCFPKWNRNNRIGLHHWCTLSQGPLALADRPPDILDTLAKSTWKTKSATASLSLSPAEIERLVKSLGCIQIDVRSALSDVPLWYPKHDPSVNRSSRISELESLRTTLKEEHIVAIIGEPKVGKSTIAQLLATDFYAAGALVSEYDFRSDDYRGRYAAAQLVTKFLFLEEILPQQSLQDDIAAFIEILGARDHLLILDNFESALDDAKLIADERLSYLIEQVLFNRGSLRSNILLTSTDPIRTRSRVLVPSFQLGGLTRDQAGSLLSGGDSGWTADQADLIYNIRHGHPYAIRLAATDITRYMSLGLSFSKAFESVAPEIINLTYGAIYQGFTPDEKRIVEILSLHFDGLDFEAVEYIAQRTSLKKGVASALSHLYERQAITKSGGRLFKLLPQDQQFVYSLIESPRELHAAAASYYYEHLSRSRTEIYEIAFEDVAQSAFFHAIRADQIDLAYAVFAGLEKPNQSGFPATIVSMGRRLQEHHLFESLPTSERAHVLHYNGRLLRHFGEIDAAKVSMEQALEISEQMSDSGWSASILSDLGMVLRKLGDYPRELEAYEKGLMLLGDDPTRDAVRTRSWILGRKGQALQRKGTAPAEIFECHKEALRLARQIDDPELISSRLGMLGGSYRELGRR